MPLNLYVTEFDPLSQRAMVAMYEAEIDFNRQTVSSVVERIPKWLLDINPQAYFPLLTTSENKILGMGSDAICAYLEKEYPKVGKLHFPKKRKYFDLIIRCKTKMEKIIEDFLKTNEDEAAAMSKMLADELEYLNSNLKGPFVLGSQLSWVDIHYWTLIERLALLKNRFGFDVPSAHKNVLQWLERVNKREAFGQARYDPAALQAWYNSQNGAVVSKEAEIGPVSFTRLFHRAILSGLATILAKIEACPTPTHAQLKDWHRELSELETVIGEHTTSENELFFPALKSRQAEVPQDLLFDHENESRMFQDLKFTINKLLEIAGLRSTLEAKQAKLRAVLDTQSTSFLKKSAKVQLLTCQVDIAQKEYSPLFLYKDLVKNLTAINNHLKKHFADEEAALADEKFSRALSPTDKQTIVRKMMSVRAETAMMVVLPWVVGHLSNQRDQDQFLKNLHQCLPYRFPYVCEWLLDRLPDEWGKIRRRNESIIQFPSEPAPDIDPFIVLRLTRATLRQHLEKLEEALRARTLIEQIDEHLNVFIFKSIEYVYYDLVVLPAIEDSNGKYSEMLLSYRLDHQGCIHVIKNIVRQVRALEYTVSDEGVIEYDSSQLALLYENFGRVCSLVRHNIWKESKQIDPLVESLFTPHVQYRLMREIFDVMPSQYFERTIPWVLSHMDPQNHYVFVQALRSIVTTQQFMSISGLIRKGVAKEHWDSLAGFFAS